MLTRLLKHLNACLIENASWSGCTHLRECEPIHTEACADASVCVFGIIPYVLSSAKNLKTFTCHYYINTLHSLHQYPNIQIINTHLVQWGCNSHCTHCTKTLLIHKLLNVWCNECNVFEHNWKYWYFLIRKKSWFCDAKTRKKSWFYRGKIRKKSR